MAYLQMEYSMKRLLLGLVCVVLLTACSTPIAPKAAPAAKALKAPTTVSYGRYILISGVWVWCETCEENGG